MKKRILIAISLLCIIILCMAQKVIVSPIIPGGGANLSITNTPTLPNSIFLANDGTNYYFTAPVANATNAQPPSTVLSNITGTGIAPGATNASAYVGSSAGLGTNNIFRGAPLKYVGTNIFDGNFISTNGYYQFGDANTVTLFTNWAAIYQRGQFIMNDSGQLLSIQGGAALQVDRGSSSSYGLTGPAGSTPIQLGSNTYLVSFPSTDNNEIYRYRFFSDNSGNDSNKIVRKWEVTNIVNGLGTGAPAIQSNGTAVATQPTINYIEGTNVVIRATNNSGSSKVDIQINAAAGGSGTPGGSDTQVQYNNIGAFGGSPKFLWNDSSALMTVTGASPIIRIMRPGLSTNEFTSGSIASYGIAETIYPDNNSSLFYTLKSNVFNFSTPGGASSGNSVNPWATNFANKYNMTGGQPTNTLLMLDAQSNINVSAWSQTGSNLLIASGGPQNIGSSGAGRIASLFSTNVDSLNIINPPSRIVAAGTVSLGVSSSNNMVYIMSTNANFTTSFSGTPELGRHVWLTVSNSALATDLTITSDAFYDLESRTDGVTTWTVKSNSIARMHWTYDTNFATRWIGIKEGFSYALISGINSDLTTNGDNISVTSYSTVFTNGVLISRGTNIDFVSGITGYVSGSTIKLGVSGGSGFAAYETGTNGIRIALTTNVFWDTGVTGYVSGSTLHLGVNVTGGSGMAALETLTNGVRAGLTTNQDWIMNGVTGFVSGSSLKLGLSGNFADLVVTNQVRLPSIGITGVNTATNIDFSLASRWIITNQLNTNMTFYLTNLVDGKSASLEIKANTLGTNFTVDVQVVGGSTNIKWLNNSITNGNFAFTAYSNEIYYCNFQPDFNTTSTNIIASYGTTSTKPVRGSVGVVSVGNSESNSFVSGIMYKTVIIPGFTNLNTTIATFTNGAQCIIGAHTLTNNGDSVTTTWKGNFLAGTNSIKLIYGYDTVLSTGSFTNSAGAWEAGMEVTRTASVGGHADAWFRFLQIVPSLTSDNDSAFYSNLELSCTNGTAITNVIQLASNRAGAVTNNYMKVMFEPGPR